MRERTHRSELFVASDNSLDGRAGCGGIAVVVANDFVARPVTPPPLLTSWHGEGRVLLLDVFTHVVGQFVAHLVCVYSHSDKKKNRDPSARFHRAPVCYLSQQHGRPCLLAGDLNTDIPDDEHLSSLLATNYVDTINEWQGHRAPTYSAGTIIDHFMTNRHMQQACVHASTDAVLFTPTHYAIRAIFQIDALCGPMMASMLGVPQPLLSYPALAKEVVTSHDEIDDSIHACLSKCDVDTALCRWSAHWEQWLSCRLKSCGMEPQPSQLGRALDPIIVAAPTPPKRARYAQHSLPVRQLLNSLHGVRAWARDMTAFELSPSWKQAEFLAKRKCVLLSRVHRLRNLQPSVEGAFALESLEPLIVTALECAKKLEVENKVAEWKKQLCETSIATRTVKAESYRTLDAVQVSDGRVVVDRSEIDDQLVKLWCNVALPCDAPLDSVEARIAQHVASLPAHPSFDLCVLLLCVTWLFAFLVKVLVVLVDGMLVTSACYPR